MAETNAIICRATLQGEIKANATLGVPVNVYVDREIYDGETDITPTEDDITLETAGKAVLENILVHGVPTDPNVYEGEFIGTETGVLTIDTGYDGDSYPKAIMIYDADGIIKEDVPKAYTITAYSALKNNAQYPTYNDDTASNGFRYQAVYTGTVTYTATGGAATYIFSQADPVMGTNSVKMPDSKTLKIYVTDVTASSAIRFRTGIRYKYQVIY